MTDSPTRRKILDSVGDVQRSLGHLEGRVSQYEARFDRLEQTLSTGFSDIRKTINGKIESHDARLDQHEALINQGRGGAKVIQWFAGIGGGSGIAAAVWTWLKAQGSG